MLPRPVPRWRTAWIAAVGAVAFAAAAPRAAADTVTLKFDHTASTSGVTVREGGSTISGIPGPYYWHEINPSAGSLYPNPTVTFCVELDQHITTGDVYTFTSITPLASAPGVSGTEAGLITKLYAAHYDTAWESGSFHGSTASTAFQLALWELVNDGNGPLSLSSGDFNVKSANTDAVNLAASWLTDLTNVSAGAFANTFSGHQLVWLSNDCNQDQLTMIPSPCPPPNGVPGPAGLVLGLIGFGGCLFGRDFRRRAADAATA